ncbi:MAG: tetratricopeptide repeat protein [Candidatus Omnitrophota bacterium]
MGTHGQLSELRLRLDDAITYGTIDEATELAREGLFEAQKKGLKGEIEYFKGQIMILKEDFESAIAHFDAAIRYNPSDGAAYNDRALSMVELGIIDEALRYFDKGIEVEPDYATIYHNKGWLLNNIGQHTEAIGCFKKALALDPDRPVTYDNLADALSNLGDFQGALVSYKKVLTLLGPGRLEGLREEISKQIHALEQKIAKQNKRV